MREHLERKAYVSAELLRRLGKDVWRDPRGGAIYLSGAEVTAQELIAQAQDVRAALGALFEDFDREMKS